MNKASSLKPAGKLEPLPIPLQAWDSVSMDLIVKLPASGPQKYDSILVFVDRLTEMVHLVKTWESITALQYAKLFIEHVFRLHGMPRDKVPRAHEFVLNIRRAVEQARLCLEKAQKRQKVYADRKRRNATFAPGDMVLLSTQNMRGHSAQPGVRKLKPRYVGPFEVQYMVGEAAVKLELPQQWFMCMVSFYLLHVGRQPLVHRLCICTCVLPSTNVIGTAVPLHRLWAHSLQCAGLRKPVGVHQAVPRKTRLVSAPAAAGIAKLNGDNWYQWEFDVQNALVLCGLDAAICAPAPAGLGTGGTDQGRSGVEAAATPDPEAVPTAALSASVNARAHAFISSTVNAAKYRFVCQSCSTARELWQKLKAMHVSKVLASSSVLIQQMSMIRMQPSQPVQEYWQHAQELDQQIAACSAPDKPFHNSFSLAVLGLEAWWQQRQFSNRGKGAGSDGGGGSRSGGDRGKGHGRRSKADSECYNCGQFGHYAYECPRASVSSDRRDSPSHSPRADRSRGDRPPTPGPRGRDSGLPDSRTRRSPSPLRHRSSLAFSGHSGADAALAVAPNLLKGQWLVDSGCSTHLTPHVELLRDYQPLRAPHHIVCGNGSTMTAAGQGSVLFEGAGGSMVLRNVLHVPDAEGSLLSVGKAARAGGEVVFTEQGCSIHMPGADHSIKARMVVEDLFLLNSKPVPSGDSSVSMSARSCDDPRLMHFRLGHPGYRQLARAVRESMLLGTSVRAAQCEAIADSGGVCEPCVLGKQHRFVAVQHPGLGLPVKRPLALVHSDVCGPFDCPTPSGNLYFVTVLDEYSGLVAVELIRQKSAAAQAIIVCLTELQRQSGHTVKALRTDRGGEFTGGELQAWLRAEGVIHQQTAPYSPEMNGSAERINRTLEECVRAMTQAVGTPKHLWGEALRTAADLHNLSAVSGKPCTPHELMFGVKPDVSHLRVWGCPAYVHDPMPASKLDSRSVKGVFVGYERGGKAYRVWAGGRIYVSKSVVFDEQTVLQRFVPHAVLAPAELAAPPMGEASRGGVGSGGTVSSNSDSEGSRGGAPAVTPIAHVSSNSSSGGGGRAGSGGDPLAAPGSPGEAAGSPSGVGGSSGGSSGVKSPAPMPAPAPEHPPPLRRSSRPHKPTVKFSDYLTVCYSARSDSCDSSGSAGSSGSMEGVALVGSRVAAGSLSTEPRSFSEAMSGPEAEEWGRAMDAEMASQHANETWQLVKREVGMSVLPGRWVLKRKLGLDSSIAKYKARWVVKGFRQRDGVDYSEDAIFAPVVMHTTQRFIFALAVQRNWGLWQIDFKTAFLNSELTEADPLIYVEQPEGYEVGSGQVCQLLKTVYGLKQAPRARYLCLRKQLELIGFHASAADPSLFSMRSSNGSMVHMLVYVDDCILALSDAAAVQAVKQQLQQAFEVHDMGPAADFLGMRISYNRASRTLRLSQQRYIEQLLQRFGKAECNGRQLPLEAGTKLVKEGELLSNADTHAYRELVGALLYASTCTRPDIALAVSQLTRFMQAPTADHERAAHGVLRYLKRTATDGLVYRGGSQGGLLGYCDSDYASDQVSYRSTTGYVFSLSGAAVSWRSKLQTTVAASTTEAEYQAAADATREALFLRKLMHELTSTSGPVPIFCDSQGAVALLKNPVESQRSKHIAVMHHMARERVWRGEVQFTYCPTADMVADVLTKALPGKKFLACKEGMGLARLCPFTALLKTMRYSESSRMNITNPMLGRPEVKPYRSDGTSAVPGVSSPPPEQWLDGEPVYTVERVLDHRLVNTSKRKGKDKKSEPKKPRLEFLVKWQGYGDEHNTWELRSQLTGCQELQKAVCRRE
ncbi:hypothetical protein QJQ45_027773 [Haematococcus lacustris]|nr:hypothetical protein QJQ45_027773 [Haematococcus lacustris]